MEFKHARCNFLFKWRHAGLKKANRRCLMAIADQEKIAHVKRNETLSRKWEIPLSVLLSLVVIRALMIYSYKHARQKVVHHFLLSIFFLSNFTSIRRVLCSLQIFNVFHFVCENKRTREEWKIPLAVLRNDLFSPSSLFIVYYLTKIISLPY